MKICSFFLLDSKKTIFFSINKFQYVIVPRSSRSTGEQPCGWLQTRLNFIASSMAKHSSVNKPTSLNTTANKHNQKLNKTIWISLWLTKLTAPQEFNLNPLQFQFQSRQTLRHETQSTQFSNQKSYYYYAHEAYIF